MRPAPGESLTDTIHQLSAAQKSNRGAPVYSRYVNRPLGRVLAAASFHGGLTPNLVTAVSAAFSASAIAVIALVRPSIWVGLVVAVLLALGYAFDAADGQLARLRGGGSLSGEWLDHMVDAAKISSLHLAVAIHLFRFADVDPVWLLVPLGYAVVGATSFFAQILNEQLLKSSVPGGGSRGSTSPVVATLKAPTDYGLLCWVFVLLGSTSVFLVVYGFMFAASAGYLALACLRWYGQMADADRRPQPTGDPT